MFVCDTTFLRVQSTICERIGVTCYNHCNSVSQLHILKKPKWANISFSPKLQLFFCQETTIYALVISLPLHESILIYCYRLLKARKRRNILLNMFLSYEHHFLSNTTVKQSVSIFAQFHLVLYSRT